MAYERTSLGTSATINTSRPCPSGQIGRANRATGIQECVPLCSSYQCQPGTAKETLSTSYVGAQGFTDTQRRRIALLDRGCARAACSEGPQLFGGSGAETYCCPDPASEQAQWRAQHEVEIARRLANRATSPVGSLCSGGVTRSHWVQECRPWVMCSISLPPPRNCQPTGKWYDESNKELCCQDPNARVVPSVPTEPAVLITRRDRDRGHPLIWVGLGLIGIGLFLIYKR